MYPHRCSLGTLRVLQESPESSGMWEEQLRRKQLLPGLLGTDTGLSQCGHTLCVPCQLQGSNQSTAWLSSPKKSDPTVQLMFSGILAVDSKVFTGSWTFAFNSFGSILDETRGSLAPGLCGDVCRALEQHCAAGNGVLIHSKWFEAIVTCSKSRFTADLRLSCSLSRTHLYNFFFIMLQGLLSFRDGRFLIRQIVPLEMKLS